MLKNKNYLLKDDIKVFTSLNNTVNKVIAFYKEDPFPNYELTDNKLTILKKGDSNIFTSG